MEFWGCRLDQANPSQADVPESTYLQVSGAALTGKCKGAQTLTATVEDKEYVLGTLQWGRCDQLVLNLTFTDSVEFSLSGSGTVDITGTFVLLDEEESVDSDLFLDEDDFGSIASSDLESSEEDGADWAALAQPDEESSSSSEPVPKLVAGSKRGRKKAAKAPASSTDSPAPSKKARKVNSARKAPQTPKQTPSKPKQAPASARKAVTCDICSRSFGSEHSLGQHMAGKHAK